MQKGGIRMSKLSKEVIGLINDGDSIKIIATSDEKGNAHTVFGDDLTVLDDGNLAFSEAFEGSQASVNLFRSIWFDKDIEVTIRAKDETAFQIKGRPYKYVYTGPLFKKFYFAAREKWGADSELAGVWIIKPLEVKNETYAVRKAEEDKKHPFFRHYDRESVRLLNK
jgi:hypothetical protein